MHAELAGVASACRRVRYLLLMEPAVVVRDRATGAERERLRVGRGGRGSAALVLAVLMVCSSLAVAAPPKAPEVKAYEEANADLEKLDADLGKRLAAWLTSDNPYRRQTALQRYRALPALLSPAAIDPLLSLLDDQERRPIGSCVYLVHRDRTGHHLGEGEYEELAHCEQYKRSNAALAAELLPHIAQGGKSHDVLCTKIIATVGRKPQHGDLLLPTARAACSYLDLLRAIPLAATPAASQALIRIFLAIGVSPDEQNLAGILPLLSSADLGTRRLAAMVVLLAGKGQDVKVPLQDAVKMLTEAVDDDKADDVLNDLPLIGEAAAPLGPALIRRLARQQATSPLATLQAIAALGKLPPGGVKQLARMLERDFPDHVLRVIAVLEPSDARKLRSQVLKAAQRKNRRQRELGLPETDLSLALRALRAADAPLSAAEFQALDRVYQRACLNEPVSYHDDPNEEWCPEAETSLTEFALEGGFRFAHRPVY
jgi:hypothetical protein